MDNEEVLIKTKRTGKEIKVKGEVINNKNLTCKIGAAFEKNEPQTIYIEISFWLDIENRNNINFIRDYDYEISRKLSKELSSIYKFKLRDLLERNEVFPYYFENIYVYNFPNNINYNEKRSFVSIELNLHTLNCNENSEKKYSLSEKKDTLIYEEALKVCREIAKCDLLTGKLGFSIHKSKN
jgi:hypothetical protein